MRFIPLFFALISLSILFAACSVPRSAIITPVSNNALKQLEDSLYGGHLGVMVVEADGGKIIAEYNPHKYFVPASNTKLVTMYAALKYLGDSLPGLRYYDAGDTIYALPTGDPTLLTRDYKIHPVANWLRSTIKPVVFSSANWRAERYGRGWSWSDYQASYMQERSALPVYGNMMPVMFRSWVDNNVKNPDKNALNLRVSMGPAGEGGLRLQPDNVRLRPSENGRFRISRDYAANAFEVAYPLKDTTVSTEIPFVTHGIDVAVQILRKLPFRDSLPIFNRIDNPIAIGTKYTTLKSQPLDSMLRPMMHRSDNFYAEQTLLMAGNEFLGYMNERTLIDTLLKTHLSGMPDKPVWVDGSGLSRYNLFSPADFVWLLGTLRKEYPIERIKAILPTGNAGTLTNYYTTLNGSIFAKTGTLSGVVGLSGYLYAKSGKLLLFSALVNNHNTEGPKVRRLVEKYLMGVWEGY